MATADDWSKVEASIQHAARKTDADLAGRLSSLTHLTDDEIRQMLPKQGDVASFAKLMTIVKSSSSEMEKVDQLRGNLEQLGGVIITVLGHLA